MSESERPELLPAVRLGLGALGVLVERDAAARARVRAARRRAAASRSTTVLDGLDERVARADHFEFYWFPHTETALTKTNTRLPGDAPRAAARRASRAGSTTSCSRTASTAAICAVGAVAPAHRRRSSAGSSSKLTGNRDFTDFSHAVFTTNRTVRFREMEYAVPLEAVPDAFARCATLIERRGMAHQLPDRGARRGIRRQLALHRARPRLRLHRGAPLLGARTRPSTSTPSSRSCSRTADARTGARCTRRVPRACATDTRDSTTSCRARRARSRASIHQSLPRQSARCHSEHYDAIIPARTGADASWHPPLEPVEPYSPKIAKPLLDDRDVDPLVAAEVAAVLGVAVAGNGNEVAVRNTGPPESPKQVPPVPAGVVRVAVDLQDLRRELLAGRRRCSGESAGTTHRAAASAARSRACALRCRTRPR